MSAPVGQRRSNREKNQIATRHKSAGQAAGLHLDRPVGGQGTLGNGTIAGQVDDEVLTQTLTPAGKLPLHAGADLLARSHFNNMTLPIVETHGFNPIKSVQRPRQAGRGILSAGKQDKGRSVGNVWGGGLAHAALIYRWGEI